ncbi:hypothetical protein L596_016200 [Steinernema carpocapsae]|uniref:Uncharacterized protein n=1 Tax=Steinernema carpocapsae TaxID=34508 RepID=A0A4U5NI91_STECR|nr:hypothetical protein L596_016200 [Steinernema carpocapsae]
MAEDYVCYPGGVSFSVKEKTTPLAEGKYLGHGVQKSVRYIENDGRSPCAAVALDLKKTVFHSEINALEYLKMQNTYVKQLIESKAGEGQRHDAEDRVPEDKGPPRVHAAHEAPTRGDDGQSGPRRPRTRPGSSCRTARRSPWPRISIGPTVLRCGSRTRPWRWSASRARRTSTTIRWSCSRSRRTSA